MARCLKANTWPEDRRLPALARSQFKPDEHRRLDYDERAREASYQIAAGDRGCRLSNLAPALDTVLDDYSPSGSTLDL